MNSSWCDGMIFGCGLTVAIVGLCNRLVGHLPPDQDLIAVGVAIMLIAGWQGWRHRPRDNEEA